MQNAWRGFHGGAWEKEVNVRDFIQLNYHPYDGDDTILRGTDTGYLRFMGSGIRTVKSRREKPAEYWIWTQKWFQPLPLMDRDI